MIFGIPVKFKDESHDQLHLKTAQVNIDINGKVEMKDKEDYDGDDIYYKLNIDFNQEIHVQHFFSYLDAISKLGGLVASIGPLLGILKPIFVLIYVIKMMNIVKRSNRKEY